MAEVFGPNPTQPGVDAAPITPGAGLLTDPATGLTYVARALVCETGGLISFVSAAGVTRTGFPLPAGGYPIGAQRVTAVTGVTNLWGIKGS